MTFNDELAFVSYLEHFDSNDSTDNTEYLILDAEKRRLRVWLDLMEVKELKVISADPFPEDVQLLAQCKLND